MLRIDKDKSVAFTPPACAPPSPQPFASLEITLSAASQSPWAKGEGVKNDEVGVAVGGDVEGGGTQTKGGSGVEGGGAHGL